MEGEGELYNFIKVWLSVVISLSCCHLMGKMTSNSTARLLCVLPIVCLFLLLPLTLHSIHLGGITAFFIAWLANFKLLLFAFNQGPLSSQYAPVPLPRFIALACLPIKIQHNKQYPTDHHHRKSLITCAAKALVLGLLVRAYDYSYMLEPKLVMVMYCCHIYFFLEILLVMIAAMARSLLGFELEQQFNEPYLSTSLQDFWGRRWNLMVSTILRPTVYKPLLHATAPIVGRKWAPLPAVFGTFVVSGLMHELMFYYLGRVKPTWEITWFFLLHGICLVGEIALKKKAVTDRWRLPGFISIPLTLAFVLSTVFWLFFPQLFRCKTDVRAFEEYAAIGAYMKNVARRCTFFSASTAF